MAKTCFPRAEDYFCCEEKSTPKPVLPPDLGGRRRGQRNPSSSNLEFPRQLLCLYVILFEMEDHLLRYICLDVLRLPALQRRRVSDKEMI